MKCRFCIEEINDSAIKCPHCLSELREAKWSLISRYLAITVFSLIIISIIISFLFDTYREWEKEKRLASYVEKPWISDYKLSISDVSCRVLECYPMQRDGSRVIKMFTSVNFDVENTGINPVEVIEVSVTFKDKENKNIYSFSSTLDETIMPGKRRNVSARLNESIVMDVVHNVHIEILRVKI